MSLLLTIELSSAGAKLTLLDGGYFIIHQTFEMQSEVRANQPDHTQNLHVSLAFGTHPGSGANRMLAYIIP